MKNKPGPTKEEKMDRIDALLNILHITDQEISRMDSEELRDWLGALRSVTRQIEREVVHRDFQRLVQNYAA